MSNNSMIQQFKLGKLNIDNTKLNNDDKIKLLKLNNLIKDLIEFYERINNYMVQFEEGHFKDDKEVKNDWEITIHRPRQ